MSFFRKSLLAVAFTTLAFASLPAKASLLLEPYVGYGMSSFTANLISNLGTIKENFNAPAYGARVGYSALMFWVAADYMMTSGTSSVQSQPASLTPQIQNDTFNASNLGVDVGISIPMIQAYVGYVLQSNVIDKASTGDVTWKGTAIKAGVGYTGLPIVAINLEYMMTTYQKVNTGTGDVGLGASSASGFADANASTLMLTVSAPFRLL